MKLNYADVIQFLTDNKEFRGKDIAVSLGLDVSQISRIKNNKDPMPYSIDPEFFFNEIFNEKKSLLDEEKIKKFYGFIRKRQCLSNEIEVAYEKYNETLQGIKNNENSNEKNELNSTRSAAESFIREVLKYTSHEAHKDFGKSIEATSISFKEYKNPIKNNMFFGRESMFEKIHQICKDETFCIIYGIGGLGKTYCALRYAIKYEKEYRHIQFVAFSQSLANTILQIPFENLEESSLTENEKLAKRLGCIENLSDHDLLIIDNMDVKIEGSEEELYYKLKDSKLHVIITTRETDMDTAKFNVLTEALSKQEQKELFEYYGNFKIDEKNVNNYYEIFDMVEGHTLLLELIAKTMAANSMSTEEMKNVLSNSDDNEIDSVILEKDNRSKQDKMNGFVATLFDTSKLEDNQKNILMILALTSVRGIRRKMFVELLGCKITEINNLIHQSWIIEEKPGEPESFTIHLHPVIKSAVISNTKPTIEKCIDFITKVSECLEKENNSVSKEDKVNLCEIIENASRMFEFRIEHEEILSRMAKILWDNFHYSSAYDIYCIELQLLLEGKDSLQYSKLIGVYEKAGKAMVRLADYEKAIGYYEKAVNIVLDNKLDEHKKLVYLYDKLGEVTRKASNYEKALAYFTKAQNEIDLYNISDSALEANIYNDMGVIYINLNILDKALENYEKAKEIRENMPVRDEAQIAYSYHNIGTVYQRKKDYQKAIDNHKEALNIRNNIYMENEPIIAASLTMIGNDYTEAAHSNEAFKYEDAWEYYEKGLKIRQNTLGENHPDTAWSYQSIGRWYFYQKNFGKAEEYYDKCLEIRKKFLKEDHAYMAEIRFALGEVYYVENKISQAQEQLSKALDIQEKLKMTRAKKKTEELLQKIQKI